MKVFIGTYENCGIVSSLRNGFKELGHEVTTWLKARDRLFPDEVYDYDYSKLLLPSNSIERIIQKIPIGSRVYSKIKDVYRNSVYKKSFESLPEHDLYIYTWTAVLPKWKDLEKIKKQGKKIIFLFIGSEARFAYAFNQEFPSTPIQWSKFHLKENINTKLSFLRTVESYADYIFSLPDQSGLLIRPYLHMYMPVDTSEIKFSYPDNEVPKIIHAPTNRAIKGTDKILESLDQLKNEGLKFDFLLIENQPNSIVKKQLETADILIDQIYAHGPGVLGSEAMAAGCAVATRYLRGYENVFAPPVCFIDASCLTDNLRKLITDRGYRKQLAFQGRDFVKEKNDPVSIAKRMISVYDKGVEKYDYTPRFYLEKFQLPKHQKLSNKTRTLNKTILDKYQSFTDLQSLKERELI